ncbi:MAG TPA: NAD(P)H-dependent glycerol-3-phosphate dehydrogenase [Terriglobia bacterium]|nr:NAD(P)H-dependent glycerol-3-phosphate dehydrogenase [Terriglobia bacterium]
MTSLAIIGAGGWGTALAVTQARANRTVRLWVHDSDLALAMDRTRENAVYLPGVHIPDTVEISNAIGDVVRDAGVVILAVPSHFYRSVTTQVLPIVSTDAVFVSATKGIENDTLRRMSEIIEETAAPSIAQVAVLSGPTFAPEVSRGEPAALVISSPDERLRQRLQTELSTPRFRLYTNADRTGVELCGAAKNTIAIAAGVADGLGLGSNAMAALVTRGLAEITRLVIACGGTRETLYGLAGLGDLVLTAYGNLSRNRRLGLELGRGREIEQITAGTRSIAEGIRTTKSIVQLAQRLGIEMPIAEKMYAVLHEGLRPPVALADLMERKLKEE